jgi:flagellar protein FlbT
MTAPNRAESRTFGRADTRAETRAPDAHAETRASDTRPGVRPMHISLRTGERLFLNGAVVKVDRKVTLELLNDATFLLENHVLQVEDTTTPLRQLYFAVQAMLMDPQNAPASRALFEAMAADTRRALKVPRLIEGLDEAASLVAGGRPFHALKTLRSMFDEEAKLLGVSPQRRHSRRRPAETAEPCADAALPTPAAATAYERPGERPVLRVGSPSIQ